MALPISIDLREEAQEFHDFLTTLRSDDWERETLFMKWSPWDVVAHLHFFDEVSLRSLEGEEAFAPAREALIKTMSEGKTTKDMQLEAFEGVGAEELLDRWIKGCVSLCAKLGECNPKARLPWFGPDMGAQMFTTARYMETWSHAQAVYDMMGKSRTHTDRIQNIVAIGVRTFGWTFVNRKIEVPGPPPHVRLVAPSGTIWEYNAPEHDAESASGKELIEGTAVDFCLTVAQVRNVKDTELSVRGDVANQWMDIAQCFAGAPVDPPAPGYRLGR